MKKTIKFNAVGSKKGFVRTSSGASISVEV